MTLQAREVLQKRCVSKAWVRTVVTLLGQWEGYLGWGGRAVGMLEQCFYSTDGGRS